MKMTDAERIVKARQTFEKEKEKINANSKYNEETFHFDSTEEAEAATKLIYDYCHEKGYHYSHICCGGKGHQINKKANNTIY